MMINLHSRWLTKTSQHVSRHLCVTSMTTANPQHAELFYRQFWIQAFKQTADLRGATTALRMTQIPRLLMKTQSIARLVKYNVLDNYYLPKTLGNELTEMQHAVTQSSNLLEQPKDLEDFANLFEYIVFLKIITRRKKHLVDIRDFDIMQLTQTHNMLATLFVQQSRAKLLIS